MKYLELFERWNSKMFVDKSPYIYQPQPKELLTEIKAFPNTKKELYRVYDLPQEQDILYYDLLSYMNKRTVSLIQIGKGRENILRRHYMLKDYSASKLLEFYIPKYSDEYDRKTNLLVSTIKKTKFFWKKKS